MSEEEVKSKTERKFSRAVLKLSGEALREEGSKDNISPEIVERMAREIRDAVKGTGLELAVVVGGVTSGVGRVRVHVAWTAQLLTMWG